MFGAQSEDIRRLAASSKRPDTWSRSGGPVPACCPLRRSCYLAETSNAGCSYLQQSPLGANEPRVPPQSITAYVVFRNTCSLELDLELRPHGSKFTPRPPSQVSELGLSQGTMSALSKEGLTRVDQLDSAASMLARPEFGRGSELYEIVCALNRHGVSLPTDRTSRIPGDRDREILRLRIVDGMTLTELGRQFGLNSERIRQILAVFGLSGNPSRRLEAPPSASATQTKGCLESAGGLGHLPHYSAVHRAASDTDTARLLDFPWEASVGTTAR